MDRLKGKRALITGGTTGIGLETAKLFLREGARVLITGTNPATLAAVHKELGPEAVVVASDAGDIAAQKALAKTVVEKFEGLDILVVNRANAFGALISRRIRVNAISPGPISTPLYDKLGLAKADLEAVAESLKNQVPARRFGNPSEIRKRFSF